MIDRTKKAIGSGSSVIVRPSQRIIRPDPKIVRNEPRIYLPEERPPIHTRRGPGVVGLRSGKVQPVDGLAFCRNVIEEIKVRSKTQRCVVAFDLDNTLFETRFRTYHVLKMFDEHHRTQHFAGLQFDDIGWNGRETALRMELPETIAEEVHTFWEEHFWDGANFAADQVISIVADLVHEAADAGAEIVYLTGRIDLLKEASRQRIEAAGLPFADDAHVLCKPTLETRTSPFKAGELAELAASGAYVGFFLTDSAREIEQMQAEDHRLPCVFFRHSLSPVGTLRPWTPQL